DGHYDVLNITSGDFDRDGHLDLAVGVWTQHVHGFVVLHNQGTGRFVQAGEYWVPAPGCITSADLNGDGYPDLAVATISIFTASVFLNHGDGTFADIVEYPAGHIPYCIASGDLDGDGLPELILTNFQRSTVSVLHNRGQGTFGAEV